MAREFGIDLTSHRSKRVDEVTRERPVAIAFVFDAPLLDWSELHGPDYSDHALEAYRFCAPRFRVPDPKGAMVQISLSIGYRTQPNAVLHQIARSTSHPLLRRWRLQGALHRVTLGRRLWLSPELSSAEQVEALGAGLLKQGQPYIHMMFHSNSLVPGLSPDTPGAAAVDLLYQRMEVLIALARGQDLVPKTPGDGRPRAVRSITVRFLSFRPKDARVRAFV